LLAGQRFAVATKDLGVAHFDHRRDTDLAVGTVALAGGERRLIAVDDRWIAATALKRRVVLAVLHRIVARTVAIGRDRQLTRKGLATADRIACRVVPWFADGIVWAVPVTARIH